MSDTERTVVLGTEVQPKDAVQALQEAPAGFGGVKEAVPAFTKVKDFTTFEAEHALIDGDIVLHFFPTNELKGVTKKDGETYWKVAFADVLNRVGQEYFDATAPRLQAKYTEELHSWWFKAQGYSHFIDLSSYLNKFFELMDSALEEHFKQATKS